MHDVHTPIAHVFTRGSHVKCKCFVVDVSAKVGRAAYRNFLMD